MPDDAPKPNQDRYPIHDSSPTLSTQDARQGETSGRMRNVLGISLLMAALVIVGLAYAWHEAKTPPTPSVMPPATNAQQTAPSAPQPHGQVPDNTTPTPPNNQGNN